MLTKIITDEKRVIYKKYAAWGFGGVLFLLVLAFCLIKMQCLIVLSGSMSPAIPAGSVVVIDEGADYEKLCVGDIITYHLSNGQSVTHRIAGRGDGKLITKGDANECEDMFPVTEEQVQGKVLFTIPKLGYALDGIKSKVTSTLSYLSNLQSQSEVFTNGGVNIETVESESLPTTWVSGTSFPKNVAVKNNGPTKCYVRIKAEFANSDIEDNCTVDWNLKDFAYDASDGYYYYTMPLKVNEQTTDLFSTITLDNDIPFKDGQEFGMVIYAEAYQTAAQINGSEDWQVFKNYKEAWQYYKQNEQ